MASRSTAQCPDSGFKLAYSLMAKLHFIATPPTEGNTQERSLPGPGNRTFRCVDFEPEPTVDKALQTGQNALSRSATFRKDDKSSSPREPPPQALSEPDVNLSTHPAPPIQSLASSLFASVPLTSAHDAQHDPSNG